MRQSGQKVRGLDVHAVDPPGLNFFLNLHALSSVVSNPDSVLDQKATKIVSPN